MKPIYLALVAALIPLASMAQTPPSAVPREPAFVQTISVSGTGRVSLTPDRISFTVGVETMAASVDDALSSNNAKVARVIDALKKAGVADKEIRTSNFSIYPQQQYVEGQRPRITGYQVSNNITVTRDRTSNVGKLLGLVVEAGANQVSGVSFVVSDPTRGRDEGLRSAFADARAKAEVLAKAAGRTIGRAISITEGGYQPPPQRQMMMAQEMAMAKDSSVPIEQGSEEIVFTVSVIFELK